MPSTATITAFYTFVAGQKARATQVNANFSLYRGHIFPIDPNTATGANNTYDLGSSEYRWRTNYVSTVNVLGATTTSSFELTADSATTTSELLFKIGGSEVVRLNRYGISKIPQSTYTTTADGVQFAASSDINFSLDTTIGTQNITNSTLTIKSLGRPVLLTLQGNTTTASGYINGDTSIYSYCSILRNGTTLTTQMFGGYTGPISNPIMFLDVVTAGTNIYSLSGRMNSTFGTLIIYGKLVAFEL